MTPWTTFSWNLKPVGLNHILIHTINSNHSAFSPNQDTTIKPTLTDRRHH